MDIRTEKWADNEIRFVFHRGEWWAVLKDIADALEMRSYHLSSRLSPGTTSETIITVERNRPVNYLNGSTDMIKSYTPSRVKIVNEEGIYEALFNSRKPEASKFRLWSAGVLKKLRATIGLNAYEALKLTDEHYQAQVDDILNRLYYDEEKDAVMISKTVAGGDVEQVLFYAETMNPAE